MFREMYYVNFVWEILYCYLWASSECMMQFLDTHKSDRDACRGSCNDDPKISKNETLYDSDMQRNICNAFCMVLCA